MRLLTVIQASVRSTIHRLGSAWKPSAVLLRRTISTELGAVQPQQVVPGQAEALDRTIEVYPSVRAVPVAVVQPVYSSPVGMVVTLEFRRLQLVSGT